MIADQLLNSWGARWDPKIAGGLPFLAVKDITMQQQHLIEQTHKTNTHYGGFTLDLVKADSVCMFLFFLGVLFLFEISFCRESPIFCGNFKKRAI